MGNKVMKLLNEKTGLMECKICGNRQFANLQPGVDRVDGITRYYRGSWQCNKGCKIEEEKKEAYIEK